MRTSIRSTNTSSPWNSPSDGSALLAGAEIVKLRLRPGALPQQVWDLMSAHLGKNLGPDDPLLEISPGQ